MRFAKYGCAGLTMLWLGSALMPLVTRAAGLSSEDSELGMMALLTVLCFGFLVARSLVASWWEWMEPEYVGFRWYCENCTYRSPKGRPPPLAGIEHAAWMRTCPRCGKPGSNVIREVICPRCKGRKEEWVWRDDGTCGMDDCRRCIGYGYVLPPP